MTRNRVFVASALLALALGCAPNGSSDDSTGASREGLRANVKAHLAPDVDGGLPGSGRTFTETVTATSTETGTETGTITQTATSTSTATRTDVGTVTHTTTATLTSTITLTTTGTQTLTTTQTTTGTGTSTTTQTLTSTRTTTATHTATGTQSATATRTATVTQTRSATSTKTGTTTRTQTSTTVQSETYHYYPVSATVTSMPSEVSDSHISMPIGPAPTMTARLGLVSLMYFLMRIESGSLRSVNTPSSVVPSTGGTNASAPVAMRSFAKGLRQR